ASPRAAPGLLLTETVTWVGDRQAAKTATRTGTAPAKPRIAARSQVMESGEPFSPSGSRRPAKSAEPPRIDRARALPSLQTGGAGGTGVDPATLTMRGSAPQPPPHRDPPDGPDVPQHRPRVRLSFPDPGGAPPAGPRRRDGLGLRRRHGAGLRRAGRGQL